MFLKTLQFFQKRKLPSEVNNQLIDAVKPYVDFTKIKFFHFEDYAKIRFTTSTGEQIYTGLALDYVTQNFSSLGHHYTLDIDILSQKTAFSAPNRTMRHFNVDALPRIIEPSIKKSAIQTKHSKTP